MDKFFKKISIITFIFILGINSNIFALSHKDWSGDKNDPYEEVNGNVPKFTSSDMTTHSFKEFSPLDDLGRTGQVFFNIGTDIMPEPGSREGSLKTTPSGWKYKGKSNNNKYDNVSGKYIFNRCHLGGWQLTSELDNPLNLVTGTRYMNVIGQLPFEDDVTDYVRDTKNHVLYRVTPIYEGDNLLCEGVQMEAYSVEDEGDGISFNIFCYNVQPGIEINYATGENWLEGEKTEDYSETDSSVNFTLTKDTISDEVFEETEPVKVSTKKKAIKVVEDDEDDYKTTSIKSTSKKSSTPKFKVPGKNYDVDEDDEEELEKKVTKNKTSNSFKVANPISGLGAGLGSLGSIILIVAIIIFMYKKPNNDNNNGGMYPGSMGGYGNYGNNSGNNFF